MTSDEVWLKTGVAPSSASAERHRRRVRTSHTSLLISTSSPAVTQDTSVKALVRWTTGATAVACSNSIACRNWLTLQHNCKTVVLEGAVYCWYCYWRHHQQGGSSQWRSW